MSPNLLASIDKQQQLQNTIRKSFSSSLSPSGHHQHNIHHQPQQQQSMQYRHHQHGGNSGKLPASSDSRFGMFFLCFGFSKIFKGHLRFRDNIYKEWEQNMNFVARNL